MSRNESSAVAGDAGSSAYTYGSIGFIGVGEIARAVVEGLSRGGTTPPQILLSPRGAAIAADLADRFSNVSVCSSNQVVAEKASVVVLSVRAENQAEALRGLRISNDTVVISVMAGVSHDELRRALGTEAPIVRAIPLPAVRDRRSVTVTYPAHPASETLFDRLGGTLPVEDESSFAALSAVTGTISGYLGYLSRIAGWAAQNGVAESQAERYVRSVFADLGPALMDPGRDLDQLVKDHETPGGINQQFRQEWLTDSTMDALAGCLDSLLARSLDEPDAGGPAPGATTPTAGGSLTAVPDSLI